jgi:AcrR family transcriptional regulator
VSTRSRLPRAEREQQMLAAARELFAQRGYAEVTMDEVAGAVGVTKPLLYTYFGNKEQLFLAGMQPAAEKLLSSVVDAVRAAETPAAALRSGLHAYFAFLDSDHDAWRVLYDESLPAGGAIATAVGEYRDRLAELVTAALREHTDAPEVEPLAIAILGAAEALGRWWTHTRAIPADRAAELLIRTIEPGLRDHENR